VGDELAKILVEASNPLLTGSYAINDSNRTFRVEDINDTHIRDTISKIEALIGLGLIIFLVTF